MLYNHLDAEINTNVDINMTHVDANIDVSLLNQEVTFQQLNQQANVTVGVPTETFVEVAQAAFEARLDAAAVRSQGAQVLNAAAAEYSHLEVAANRAMAEATTVSYTHLTLPTILLV